MRRFPGRPVLQLLGFVVLSAGAGTGQVPEPLAPSPAWSAGVAADAARGRVVVFGGYFRGLIGSTWEWDGREWRQFTGPGPSARNSPAMVYDSAHAHILLFGGDRGAEGALADTWVYDRDGWRQLATRGPPARSLHAMVYDSRRGRVVLFGGASGGETLRDTWEWDGNGWTLVASTGPAPRALHGLAYDPVRGVTVLFGGQTRLAPDAPSLADTWEWDGSRWSERSVDPAGPRDHISMAFDPGSRSVLLYGVGAGGAGPGESWSYRGAAWIRVSESGPRRGGGKLVHEPAGGAVLLYGGGDGAPTNELWRWSGGSWTLVK